MPFRTTSLLSNISSGLRNIWIADIRQHVVSQSQNQCHDNSFSKWHCKTADLWNWQQILLHRHYSIFFQNHHKKKSDLSMLVWDTSNKTVCHLCILFIKYSLNIQYFPTCQRRMRKYSQCQQNTRVKFIYFWKNFWCVCVCCVRCCLYFLHRLNPTYSCLVYS